MFFSIYPWSLRAWRSALRTAGFPGFALLCLLLGTMLQTADASSAGSGAGHTSATLILLVRLPFTLLALFFLFVRPRISRVSITDSRFVFLIFAVLYLTSTLWSEHIPVTLGKAVEIMLAALVFLEASRSSDPLRRVDALRNIILLTISLLGTFTVIGFALRLSDFVQDRAGLFTSTTAQSPFLSGNGLGYVSSALFLVVLAEWQGGRIRRRSALLQMAFAMAMFSVSASRTSFVILVLSTLFITYKKSKVASVFAGALVLTTFVLYRSSILLGLQGGEAAADFQTLSGRTVVWNAAFREWLQHPILGSGGGVGGKIVIEHLNNSSLEKMSSLHNGFMELLVGLGAIGFVLGVCLLLLVTYRVWQAWRAFPEYSGIYVLIFHVWLTTFMSTGVLGWMGYEMALFLCILTNIDLLQHHRSALYAPAYEPMPQHALALR